MKHYFQHFMLSSALLFHSSATAFTFMPQTATTTKIPSSRSFLPKLSSRSLQSCALQMSSSSSSSSSSAFSVKASTLEENLTEEETTIVRVFRQCGPSVAYVTSFFNSPTPTLSSSTAASRSKANSTPKSKSKSNSKTSSPSGRALGSGSGFVIEEDGYLVTNYHVIQRAHEINQSFQRLRNITTVPLNSNSISNSNSTIALPSILQNTLSNSFNITSNALGLGLADESYIPAKVYVRINSSTKYQLAEIIGIKPELDVAVLKIAATYVNAKNETSTTEDTFPQIQMGSSSDLLVGQRVVAIGNPFGLDQTVTTGVVSALDRDVTGVAGNKIPNCIQTDAAINPGNSGGPLLNSQGQLVGVNTMIITTSGSNAGIGFAIPVDAMKRVTQGMVDSDRRRRGQESQNSNGGGGAGKKQRGYLGITLASDELTQAIWKKKQIQHGKDNKGDTADMKSSCNGVLIVQVKRGSAAEKGNLMPMKMKNGTLEQAGDMIVAINGNEITKGRKEVEDDFRNRKQGEQLMLTLEGEDGTRRVEYVTLL